MSAPLPTDSSWPLIGHWPHPRPLIGCWVVPGVGCHQSKYLPRDSRGLFTLVSSRRMSRFQHPQHPVILTPQRRPPTTWTSSFYISVLFLIKDQGVLELTLFLDSSILIKTCLVLSSFFYEASTKRLLFPVEVTLV